MKKIVMINRRNFIKTVLAGSAIVALPSSMVALSRQKPTKIVLLHTNDTHSRIDPLPTDDIYAPNMGGVARRAALIEKIRSENEHVLLFDSGDIFQGTPYFNYYGGKIELELMSKMKYDAACPGNHEFDNGIEHFANMLKYASFPFVNCNYDISNTSLKGKLSEWIIIQKGNLKIGITGLGINLAGLVSPINSAGLIYNDPITAGEKTAKMLKKEKKCNLVIALSHLGFDMKREVDDKRVAAQTRNIDIILGGHTHTFLKTPELIPNLDNKKVIVCQSGASGVYLGRIDLTLDKEHITISNNQYVLN